MTTSRKISGGHLGSKEPDGKRAAGPSRRPLTIEDGDHLATEADLIAWRRAVVSAAGSRDGLPLHVTKFILDDIWPDVISSQMGDQGEHESNAECQEDR
jgi:hypothetical protein